MEMKEVVIATSVVDHMSMSSSCSTPYMSAASSPQRSRPRPRHLDFFYYSAPTSPRSSSSYLYDDPSSFDDDVAADKVPLLGGGLPSSSSAAVPFEWELKPGVAKTAPATCSSNEDQGSGKEQVKDEFEFDFSGQLDKMVRPSLSSADELFDGGKIRPMKLKPPPRLHISSDHDSRRIRPDSPSPKSKFKDAFSNVSVSPRHHRRRGSDYQDPFEAALCNTTKDDDSESRDRGRGRGRAKPTIPTSPNKNSDVSASRRGANSGRKGISRSLSPLRVSEFALLHEQYLQDQQNQNETSSNNSSRAVLSSNYSRKWKLKDLFLFRSASEGHYKDSQSFSKRWSFRSSTTAASGSGSVSESGSVSKRRGGQASAHEMHYTTNKAVSEEMKKKTTLPYKHGLLACLGFSPLLPQFSSNFLSSPSSPLSY